MICDFWRLAWCQNFGSLKKWCKLDIKVLLQKCSEGPPNYICLNMFMIIRVMIDIYQARMDILFWAMSRKYQIKQHSYGTLYFNGMMDPLNGYQRSMSRTEIQFNYPSIQYGINFHNILNLIGGSTSYSIIET